MIGLAISLLLAAPLWVIVMFVAVSQANQIHAWAHSRSKSRIVRGLQEFGFFQSPRHHSVHHRSPFDVRYFVMSDWLNPALDTLRVWRGIEILFALFGARAKA
jgi:ubiquitin-conjugating enzyme E2 variant